MCFIQDLSCSKKISTGSYLIYNMFKNNKSLVSCCLLITWYDIISILVGNLLFYQYENRFRKLKGIREVTKLVRGSPQKKILVYFLNTGVILRSLWSPGSHLCKGRRKLASKISVDLESGSEPYCQGREWLWFNLWFLHPQSI